MDFCKLGRKKLNIIAVLIKCIEKISLKFMLKWKTAVYTSHVYIVQKVIDLHLIVGDSYKSVNF